MGNIRIRITQQLARVLFAAFVSLLVALPSLAQTTGQLKVTVLDQDDIEVPGALVTVTGEGASPEPRETDDDGEAVFRDLIPGLYEARVSHPAFADVRLEGILVQINRTTSKIITMEEDQGVEIVVEATQDAVDTTSTSRSQVLDKEFLTRVPTGRSYQQSVQAVAGVTGGGGNPQMAGGATDENTYMLDGANITDPVTGTFSANFNFDAIEQVEVLLGGYMPEYGVSIGGIINLVTKSGTNNLEFLSTVYYTNGNTRPRMDERLTADGFVLAPTGFDNTFETLQIAGALGGPVVRDKAWFFLSYQQDRSLIANTGIPQPRDYEGHYVLAKLTVQPTSEHRITAFVQMDPSVIDNIDQGDPYYKAEAQGRQAQGGFIASGRWQWFLSPDVSLDTQFTHQKSYIEVNGVPCTHNRDKPYHPCRPGEAENTVDWESPGRLGLFGAYNSINWGQFYFDDRLRYQASSKLAIVGVDDPFGGTHDFKIGVEGTQLVWDQIQGFSGNALYYDLNETSYDPESLKNYYWIELSGPIKFRTTGSSWNFFVQDSYKPVPNLTINYGTRFDNAVNRNDLGEPVLATSLLGPRLFAAWDPFSDQRTKVATGWGRFNDTGRLSVASFTSAASYGQKLYLGEFFNDGAQSAQGFLNTQDLVYFNFPPENLNISHDNLRNPSVDEFILLLEREVIEDVAVYSNMSGKFSRYLFESDERNLIYDEDGSAVIGSRFADSDTAYPRLRTPALAKRDYYQWDLGLRKVQSKRWYANASYTFTRLVGSSGSSLSGTFMNDPQTQYNYGPLFADINHQVKMTAYWDLPTDPNTTTLGAFLQYYSGEPIERRYYNDQAQGYDLRIKSRTAYTRYPAWWELNLQLIQAIDVRRGKLSGVLLAENITNNRAPFGISSLIYTENRMFATSRQSPFRLTLGARYEF